MSTIDRNFYDIISVMWNDTETTRRHKRQTLANWAYMAFYYKDFPLVTELSFLIKILEYKE